jgi:hypothetical protein
MFRHRHFVCRYSYHGPGERLGSIQNLRERVGFLRRQGSPLAAVSAIDPATYNLTTSFNLSNLNRYLTVEPPYFVSIRAVALAGLKTSFSPPASLSF